MAAFSSRSFLKEQLGCFLKIRDRFLDRAALTGSTNLGTLGDIDAITVFGGLSVDDGGKCSRSHKISSSRHSLF
jgi:hypothetical protein